MMLPRMFFILMMLTVAPFFSKAQVDDQNVRLQVLEKGIVDSTFIFGKWTDNGGTETHLTYLGQVTTTQGQIFKVVNSSWFWGLSHRASSRILIFNEKNQYVGNYGVGSTYDLPGILKDGKLIFKNTDKSCDAKLISVVDLNNGLPKQFFRKCKGEYGDIYIFE